MSRVLRGHYAQLQAAYRGGWWWGFTSGACATSLLWALLYIAWAAWPW